ncbi:hypothetical protein ONZ45_g13307 [Pleurotus djamor]|nr:hypothetical protein ONZ45_g13307 [Pleurotus djamor]
MQIKVRSDRNELEDSPVPSAGVPLDEDVIARDIKAVKAGVPPASATQTMQVQQINLEDEQDSDWDSEEGVKDKKKMRSSKNPFTG